MTLPTPQDQVLLPTGRLSQAWQRFFQGINSKIGDVVTYTPAVGASTGTINSATASATYQRVGRFVIITGNLAVVDNGTGSGTLYVSLPNEIYPVGASVGTATKVGSSETGVSLQAGIGQFVPALGKYSAIAIANADGTYPASAGLVKTIFNITYPLD